MRLTVGFDLDMTLIDSRPGVARAVDVVAAEFDLPVRGADVMDKLGPPMPMLLAEAGLDAELVPAFVARYREFYPSVVAEMPALPGAEAALAAVVGHGGRVLVVTGKHTPFARLHMEHLGWQVDAVVGDLWAGAKSSALREHGAHIFVGDHAGDMHGAKGADALAVGVTTGPCDADELRAAGADVVLSDLTDFPAWLAERAVA
ncbi:MAG TPA: HAD hydrolase-like protein [Nocardia sp.]|uniref:HAD family hydrolase n=1 Tax=Nocardia TaxID=1817 RepID=UPI002453DC70|nr:MULTISPECIES: HAD hydrolase-like protein [Nocardia]HLS78955.1 HAD hydrolase-like protein [Nocardia sp.]